MEGTREHAELIGHDQPIGPSASMLTILTEREWISADI